MAKEELECSFCGRKKPETNLLIAGLDAHICDRCIEQAHGIVVEESKQNDTNDLSAELKPSSSFVYGNACLLISKSIPLCILIILLVLFPTPKCFLKFSSTASDIVTILLNCL